MNFLSLLLTVFFMLLCAWALFGSGLYLGRMVVALVLQLSSWVLFLTANLIHSASTVGRTSVRFTSVSPFSAKLQWISANAKLLANKVVANPGRSLALCTALSAIITITIMGFSQTVDGPQIYGPVTYDFQTVDGPQIYGPVTYETNPPVFKADGSRYSDHDLRRMKEGNSFLYSDEVTERTPTTPGQPFVPLPSEEVCKARKTLTAATTLHWDKPEGTITSFTVRSYTPQIKDGKVWVIQEGDDYVIAQDSTLGTSHAPVVGKFPKEAFVEYGGTDKKEIAVPAWNWPPIVPYEKRVANAGYPDNPQGYTPELSKKLSKVESPYNNMPVDFLGTPDFAIKGTKPVFEVFAEFWEEQSKKPEAEQLTKSYRKHAPHAPFADISLREEFNKWKVTNKTSSRPELSCVPLAFQAALELLWSRKEGRPVKLSVSYLRWAHDQLNPENKGESGTSFSKLGNAILRYGVCEAALMPDNQRVPSAAAIANAAKRKTLITRRVCVSARRESANQPSTKDTTIPVMVLIINELTKGHPIFITGPLVIPKTLSNPYVLTWDADRAIGFPENFEGPYDHARLITGIKTTPAGTMFENKDNGTSLGDKGWFYTSIHDIYVNRVEYLSLGLE